MSDSFRDAAHRAVDWIADYLDTLDAYPVSPDVRPGYLTDQLPTDAPDEGEPFDQLLADFERLVVPGLTHWNHPGFMAYFNSSASEAGILGEMLTAAVNVNAMLWASSPAATELETVTLAWLRGLVGLPATFEGVLYEGGSTSTVHALAAARAWAGGATLRTSGVDGLGLRLYAADTAHSSVDKAVLTLGLGLDAIRRIPVDDAYRLRPDGLAAAVDADRRAGFHPFCAVASIGSTSCTSVDPVDAVADVCARENLWLHLDAAHGGALALLPECSALFAGWERADSVVINPHKWLFVPLDCSALLTRRLDDLRTAFELVPDYLQTDDEARHFMDYGVPLGRRFRALKLWFVLRHFGRAGLQRRLRTHLDLARRFAARVDAHPDFERLAPVPMSTVCFRARPPGLADDPEALDALNTRLLAWVNRSGDVFLTHTRLDGRYTIRLVVSGLRVETRHVDRAWTLLREGLAAMAE